VPDDVPDEVAVLIDPVACSFHAVLRQGPADGDRVLVVGGGMVGLGVVMSLRALGYDNEVICVARHAHQGERLRAAGADRVVVVGRGCSDADRFRRVAAAVGGRRLQSAFGNQSMTGGADIVYECVGSGRSLNDAMKFCTARGTLVLVGTAQLALVDATPLWFSELRIVGAYGRQMEDRGGEAIHTYDWVIDLVREGRLKLAGLLTHTFAPGAYRQAFRTLMERGRSDVVKVAFRHGVEELR
jgi:threonine dehydrogenase-like Zn-dependent dehydrogenase